MSSSRQPGVTLEYSNNNRTIVFKPLSKDSILVCYCCQTKIKNGEYARWASSEELVFCEDCVIEHKNLIHDSYNESGYWIVPVKYEEVRT